jgi:hypothetical protein
MRISNAVHIQITGTPLNLTRFEVNVILDVRNFKTRQAMYA